MTITQLINKTYLYTKTNISSLPTADILLYLNSAYERVASLIIKNDGRWQWDDTNQTDIPIATTTITANQQDYTLATDHIEITRVEIKGTDGLWYELKPIDSTDIENVALSEYYKTAGRPVKYDKVGVSVFLYPKPDYTQSASLKLYFQRAPILFTSGDVSTGTKAPGFNSLYHNLIALWASYDYGIANGLQNVNQIMQEIIRGEDALEEDYAKRNKDEKTQLKLRTHSSK